MKKFQIKRSDFLKYKIDNYPSLSINSDINSMEKLISYFNQEYKWDDMFTMSDVFNRISEGHTLFTISYNGETIGYIWYRMVTKKICKAYNLYVTKIIKRPDDVAYWFYNKTTEIMLNTYDKIICEAEDWNIKVHDIFFKSGFRQI